MPYINWKDSNNNEPSLSFPTKWYKTQTVIGFLHRARQYIVFRDREGAPLLYCDELPAVTRDQRFSSSEDAVYICEAVGCWNMRLDVLQYILHRISSPGRSRLLPAAIVKDDAFGRMDLFGLCLINSLLQDIGRRKDMLDRAGFEARFKLVWRDQKDHNVMSCENIFCASFARALRLGGMLLNKQAVHDKQP